MLRDLDNGRVAFRRVVLETTGLADPAPVLQTAMAHPYLVMRYRLDGVVTVVDAINGAATLDQHMESVKQVAVADRLVLTKTDLLDTPERRAANDELLARLRALNPAAPHPRRRRRRSDAGAPARAAASTIPTRKIARRQALARRRGLCRSSRRPRSYIATHDVNRHDERIRAFAFATDDRDPGAPCSRCSSISCAPCTVRTCCASRAS